MKIKVLLSFALLLFSFVSYPQPTPPPSHGSNTTKSNPQSAPIGTSTILLISLGAVYTSIKIYSDIKNDKDDF